MRLTVTRAAACFAAAPGRGSGSSFPTICE
jgi:hypothetical protein